MPARDDAREAWRRLAALFLSPDFHDRFHDATEAAGLPHPGALKLLLVLRPGEPRAMRELAEVIRCDASYVTSLVDAIEAPGYVERRTAEADRRVKEVHLTDAGVRAQSAALDAIATPSPAMKRLTSTETRTLATLLAKLTDDA